MKLGPQQVVICVDYTGQSVSMVFILPSNNGGGVISPCQLHSPKYCPALSVVPDI